MHLKKVAPSLALGSHLYTTTAVLAHYSSTASTAKAVEVKVSTCSLHFTSLFSLGLVFAWMSLCACFTLTLCVCHYVCLPLNRGL